MHVVEASLGGIARHIWDLMRELHALGLDQVLVYSPVRMDVRFRQCVDWCSREGIACEEVGMTRAVSLRADIRSVVRLINLVKTRNVRILHLHSSKAGGVGRLAALFLRNVRVVYTPNGNPSHLSWRYGVIEFLLGRIRTDRLIAVSASEYRELARLRYVKRERLIRIDSGIDPTAVVSLATGSYLSERMIGRSIVATVGRIARQKDPLFLADVSRIVLDARPDAKFLWIGDGEMRRDFVAAIRRLGVEEAWTITGWVENPYKVLRQASVFALASRYESFGYVTLEAMALGLPVVGTKVAGTMDLVEHQRTGFLVPLGSTNGFADAVIRLLQSERLRRTLGEAGRSRAVRFGADGMAIRTLHVYEELAE